jgi:uncharacterized protein (DUF1330 family)
MIAIRRGSSTCSENSAAGCFQQDENPTVLEGAWDRDKLVLMSFPGEAAYRAWADSPEYLEISKERKAGARAIVLLAKGFTPGTSTVTTTRAQSRSRT